MAAKESGGGGGGIDEATFIVIEGVKTGSKGLLRNNWDGRKRKGEKIKR